MVSLNIPHHTIIVNTLVSAGRQVRSISIAGTKLLLSVGLNIVNCILRPERQAIPQVGFRELGIGTGRPDDLLLREAVRSDWNVRVEDWQIIKRLRCLSQFLRVS